MQCVEIVFEAVFSTGNISHAARQLALSQPAVSNALTRLRDEHGAEALSGLLGRSSALALCSAIPGVWVSPDHRCIVWCKQLVLALSRALFDSIDPQTRQVPKLFKFVVVHLFQNIYTITAMITNTISFRSHQI